MLLSGHQRIVGNLLDESARWRRDCPKVAFLIGYRSDEGSLFLTQQMSDQVADRGLAVCPGDADSE